MTVKVIPFKPGHFDFMDARKIFDGDTKAQERIEALSYTENCVVWTMVVGSTVIAVIGGHVVHQGTAEIWSVTSEAVANYGVSFIMKVRRLLKVCKKRFKLHRYQMAVNVELPGAKRFGEALGFELEGIMKNFGPGREDHYLFARVY